MTSDQNTYSHELLETFGMLNAKEASIPLDPGMRYRQATGYNTLVVKITRTSEKLPNFDYSSQENYANFMTGN